MLDSWWHDGVLLKAVFQVDRYPVQDRELIWHRYEDIVTPGRASYRYFLAGETGGMLVTPYGLAKTELKGRKVFGCYPTTAANLALLPGASDAQAIQVKGSASDECIYII